MSHPVPAPDSGPDAGAVWHYGDPLGEQRAAETDAIVVDRSHRGVLTLTGNDRQTWLHSISTQHVSNLPEGASTQNLSLDGQGRVEDHWIQTELGGTTYLDTEPWRAAPLLEYLRKMVFWSEVTPSDADLAVLSLLGPRLADQTILDALGVDALPAELSAVPLDGGFVRRMPGTPAGSVELDLVVPRGDAGDWRNRLSQAGVRPGGVWAYEAHRVAAVRPRLGVDTDERTIPHEVGWIGGPGEGAVHLDKGCYRGQETVARVHNLGRPPRMLVLLHLDGSVERPSTGDPVLAGGRAVGRLGTVVDHVDLGPIALALLKRGLPAETELATGPEAAVAAVIDVDSLPPTEQIGAGRLAVERLRGGAG
ncbi:CAF17-like 4Fe-4S cluster assembly/insertion protein YgfZ [Mycobacterium intracellulare]|uniref:Glycine cleavage T-protein (Aminomethyl transferase) n=1 Tax=Mycobacterium intracellulare (strain ATCC 13950 / DSM 43223 / JCM 6384 / NCTC 13025 / 3600) TaxID=487521 RepID=H8IQ50_MYCIA|nr:folate-binding protein YgfZ [Mycobacterium intracellulare]AFC41882.1 glycine cleavage T-protein (aminomethyl transferase) [Mycobacterium intracellulare ATCC 13950]ASW93875.1 folate-binding protein [Mycobacterium intracellulare]MCA2232692.1 folate-binding protein YgfZ [Mycobacterium intracellulare]MCA2247013.1 folate-binding protein YgfZ [Mycobacterium intracellulare]MCA2274824.1 folate-binding protein YgfZ [Mycobacterium intracellulare]